MLGPRASTRDEARDDGVEQLGVIGRDRHDIVDAGPDRLLQDPGGQFVDDHDGAAGGSEGHEPGDLGDDGVGGLRWTEDDDAGTRCVDGLGEGGQVRVADDLVVELADVVGQDTTDDLVRVDDADDRLCVIAWVAHLLNPRLSCWRG